MVSSKKYNLKRILTIAFVIVVCFGFTNTVAAATATPVRSLGLECFPGTSWWKVGEAIHSAIDGLPCALGWGISNVLITISSGFMFLTSILFNGIISYTIVNLASHIGSSSGSSSLYPSILAGWKTFRDLGNIFFIFILLYIAISTILRLNGSDTKKLLTSVIIVALLVNFSMFFAEVIIDGTNILALTFLSKITVTGKSGNASLVTSAANYADGGLASAYLQNLGLGNFYGPPAATNSQPQGTANSNIPSFQQSNWISVLFVAFLTAIVMFVVGFVLLISSILFLIRYVVFIFLLILSPLAFVGSILPKTKSLISDKWWKTLFDQSLFAPIYFMLSWATIKVMQGVVGNSPKPINVWGLFSGGATSAANDVANLLINYLIIVIMLITTLVISKSMASSGGDAVKKSVDWASGKAGGLYTRSAMRASYAGASLTASAARLPLTTINKATGGGITKLTGGKFENKLGYSPSLKNADRAFSESAFGNTGIGRAIREATTGAAMTSKLGGGKSIADIEKEKKTANDKYAKVVDEATDKNYEKNHLPYQRENQKADLRAQKVGATPERRAELDKQIAEVQDRVNRGSPLTSAEKNSKHYQDHLLEQAKKLEGKHKLLQSGARKAAAKQMRDKWRGKKSSAEEILSSFAASTTPPATPAPGGAPHTP